MTPPSMFEGGRDELVAHGGLKRWLRHRVGELRGETPRDAVTRRVMSVLPRVPSRRLERVRPSVHGGAAERPESLSRRIGRDLSGSGAFDTRR
jgi:hypothetical protein